MTTTASEAKLLRDAAEILERGGWCQDKAHDEKGRHCTAGAIQLAAVVNSVDIDWPSARYEFLCLSLADFLGVDTIADWNDAPERTVEEVIKSLRACADYLEGPDGGSVDYYGQ